MKKFYNIIFSYKLIRLYELLSILIISAFVNFISNENYSGDAIDWKKVFLYLFSAFFILIFFYTVAEMNNLFREVLENKEKDSKDIAYANKINANIKSFHWFFWGLLLTLILFIFILKL